jgi:hypothetical protein
MDLTVRFHSAADNLTSAVFTDWSESVNCTYASHEVLTVIQSQKRIRLCYHHELYIDIFIKNSTPLSGGVLCCT